MGSVEQDTREYHDKLANYNKAIEALIPLVKEERTLFDEFLMTEYTDLYNQMSENEINGLQRTLNAAKRPDAMKDKWLEYVEDEAKRRVDG